MPIQNEGSDSLRPGQPWGIYLLSEGLHRTIFESQVLSHAKYLAECGIKVEIWAFTLTCESRGRSAELLPRYLQNGIVIRLLRGVRGELPLSRYLNGVYFYLLLKRLDIVPAFVHCRTAAAAEIAAFARQWIPFRMVWDSRGDTESELSFHAKGHSVKTLVRRWIGARAVRRQLQLANQCADGAIFVSEGLKTLHCGGRLWTQSAVVPCAADGTTFYFSAELRAATRHELGIGENESVVLYSGSLAPWQCFRETVALIQELLQGDPALKAIVLTPDERSAKEAFVGLDQGRIILKSVGMREVNRYLNAADYAILLRNSSPTNKVASPVKFAEYCLTGLPVIMTNAVDQAVDYSTRLGNRIDYEFGKQLVLPRPLSEALRSRIAHSASLILQRSAMIPEYLRLYGLPPNLAHSLSKPGNTNR